MLGWSVAVESQGVVVTILLTDVDGGTHQIIRKVAMDIIPKATTISRVNFECTVVFAAVYFW